MIADDFQRVLEECDIAGARRLWATVAPGLPQPHSDSDVEATIHLARTAAQSVRFRLRAWSHRWAIERGLPSQLPDELRPRAERLYPRKVTSVGIGVMAMTPGSMPLAKAIEGAMSDAVMDAYAEGREEPVFVKARMLEARAKILRG